MVRSISENVRQTIHNIQPYIPGKPISDVQRELGLTDVIKMASNENPLGPSPMAQEAIIEAVKDLHRYPDGGQLSLKKDLEEYHHISEGMLIVGNGSDEIIKLACETFLEPGDEIIVPAPSFSEYKFAATLMSANTVEIRLGNNFEYDLDDFKQAITPKTKIIFLCSPNNPTGTYIRQSDMQSFLDSIPKDILVIIDEAYSGFVDATDYAEGLDFIKRGYSVAVMRTFSKMYALAALRIGYMIANKEIIQFINRAREPFNVNHLAQVGAMAALQDQGFVRESVQVNYKGKHQLYRAFEQMGLSYIPTQANFLIVDVGIDSAQVFQAMLRKGVIIRDGGFFGLPTFIRVSVGLPEENETFIQALQTVLQELR